MDLSKISNSQNEHTKSEESELIVKTSADTTSLDAAQNTQTDSSSVTISSSNERQKHSSRCNDIHQTLSMLSDEPTSIIAEEADALGLRNYSMIIARTALSNDGPFTIGVHGGWGEGKTTALLQCGLMRGNMKMMQILLCPC